VHWAASEKGYSQRRACALIGSDPRAYPDLFLNTSHGTLGRTMA
jgi:hypothetical protein